MKKRKLILGILFTIASVEIFVHRYVSRFVTGRAWPIYIVDFVDVALLTAICIPLLSKLINRSALAESERERLSMAVEQAAESIVITDPHGTIVYVNPAFEKLAGYTREDVLGKNPRILKSGVQGPEFYKTLWQTLTAGKAWSGRFINKRKDRSLWEEETIISPVRDENGSLVNYVAVKRDVTAERVAEQMLREYAAIVESSDEAIIGRTLEDIITSWNRGAEKLFGYTSVEALGQPFSLLLPSDRICEEAEMVQRIKTKGESVHQYEAVWKRRDGSQVCVGATLSPIKDADGKIIGASSIIRDITDRKRSEEESAQLNNQVAKHRKQLESIVASVPGVVWEAWGNPDAPEQRIGYVSEYVETLLGYSVAEWLSTPYFWLTIVDPEDKKRVAAEAARQFTQCEGGRMEFRWVRKDGRRVWVEARTTIITGDDGQPIGMRGVNIDITERKTLEAQLRQAQKMEAIGSLAGGIAHDFNNMLTVVNGYSDLAIAGLHPDDPLRSKIAEIKKAGSRAASLTHQLLIFSRKQVLQPTALDLNSVIQEIEKMLRRLIGENIELLTVLGSELGSIRADRGQIEQVVMNLAVNARDAMPSGGKLSIETQKVILGEEYFRGHIDGRPGPYVMLAVSDTGIGMDEQTQARIFEPFFTTKDSGKGTGLGLSTVYGIVRQGGGIISVYSEVGHGTTFKIHFPSVSGEAQQPQVGSQPAEIDRGTETILLTEDDDSVRKLTRSMLEACGYAVLEAANMEEAISISERHTAPIILLLTDVIMPRGSGVDLAYRLAQTRPELKVLYMSGYTDNAIVHQGVLDRRMFFIQKPFDTSSLAQKVREVLANGSQR